MIIDYLGIILLCMLTLLLCALITWAIAKIIAEILDTCCDIQNKRYRFRRQSSPDE